MDHTPATEGRPDAAAIGLDIRDDTYGPNADAFWHQFNSGSVSQYFFFPEAPAPVPSYIPAVIPCCEFDDFADWERIMRKFRRHRARNSALEKGYYCKMFNWKLHIPDVYEINTSKTVRSGGQVRDQYLRSIEELGGAPDRHWATEMPKNWYAWNLVFGVFLREPGHRQGEIVVDERLTGYITVRRIGDVAMYGMILGHGAHLEHGAMVLLNHEVLRWISEHRDDLTRGLRYVMYGAADGGGIGLMQWKKWAGFKKMEIDAYRDRPPVLRDGKVHDIVPYPPSAPALTSLAYLEDLLTELRQDARVCFLRYDDLAFPDDPKMPAGDRCAAEAATWNDAVATGRRDPSAFYLLIQYNADADPDAVDAVVGLHRRLGIPYSLMTFHRWRTPVAKIIETYPLDWPALQQDVATGLASVGYLNNALHLSEGDVAAAAAGFDADVGELRQLGLGCPVFMPWGRAMSSRDLTSPVFVDWWQISEMAPLWIYNRFGIRWTSYYVDTVLREALAGGDAVEPVTWFSRQRTTNGRHMMLLHPHHYSADLNRHRRVGYRR